MSTSSISPNTPCLVNMADPQLPSSSSSPHPPEEQPDSKRLKMSSTTTSDDGENHDNGAAIPRTPRYKRRKIAILFAYCGVGYQGMQKNPGAKTIEGDLEEALYQSGAVPEAHRGRPKQFDWARSARTDKGVSAVGQVVSGRFYVDPPGFIERLNSNLVPQIRIFGYKRVTGSFSAKKFCDRRRYVYLLPVFALDPSCHRDRETVLASVGSGNELVKCLECSERGRKVFGVMGKWIKTPSGERVVDSSISSNNGSALIEGNIALTSEANAGGDNGSDIFSNSEKVDKIGAAQNGSVKEENDAVSLDSTVQLNNSDSETDKLLEEKSEFCYDHDIKERFNRILKYYEGTHNFHNFTTRTKAEDPSAKRHILSFNANTVVPIDGIDFVKCVVVGQSFMLHQIRKMIGLAVAIMRNSAPEELIETAFEQKVDLNVPMAPEVGLYLDECFFPSYNKKWKDSHDEVSMEAYTEEAEDFKMKYIYPHVAAAEHKDGVVALFLHSLNYRNYRDLRAPSNDPSSEQPAANEAVGDCQPIKVNLNMDE